MICKICGVNETDNPDAICNDCKFSMAMVLIDLKLIPPNLSESFLLIFHKNFQNLFLDYINNNHKEKKPYILLLEIILSAPFKLKVGLISFLSHTLYKCKYCSIPIF